MTYLVTVSDEAATEAAASSEPATKVTVEDQDNTVPSLTAAP